MRTTTVLIVMLLSAVLSVNAQSISGKLTLNNKSKTELKLKTNSAVLLFKEFKEGKHQLKFDFKAKDVPVNKYKEAIVFFEFITTVKKDGELVKNVIRKQPIPYFPGEMFLPAEAFDFVGVLASVSKEKGYKAVMPKGKYAVKLVVKPVEFKGEIAPLEFSFFTN